MARVGVGGSDRDELGEVDDVDQHLQRMHGLGQEFRSRSFLTMSNEWDDLASYSCDHYREQQ